MGFGFPALTSNAMKNEAHSQERKIAGKVCEWTGNILVGMSGVVALSVPSSSSGFILLMTIANYVVLQQYGAKVLDSFFNAVEKL